MTPSLVLFWVLAIISVGAAIQMVVSRNPVRSALALVVTFLGVAVYYVTLSAQFIAAVQIIVYAGAIMVLFLFVIMLLNMGAPEGLRETGGLQKPAAWILGGLFVIALLLSRSLVDLPIYMPKQADIDKMGTVEAVGLALYSPQLPWLFPFEVTSILLLVAVVGAIIMAKRRI
jgi:NADH-quinone oxidoreductase subunit J